MSKIKFGCQTYGWQMSFDKYNGKIQHISQIAKKAGFYGLEAEVCMLGESYFSDWIRFRDALAEEGLTFAALALPMNWRNPSETEEELMMAQRSIEFAGHFPGCKLMLAHLPGTNREHLKERQTNQIKCITDIAKRTEYKGIETVFHPNSSFGSAFRTREDYEILLSGIENSSLCFAPDAGHIAHGDMDPLDIIKTYYGKVRHVHFKDMSSEGLWRPMGKGNIDFKGIVDYLADKSYDGWIMVEEESKEAIIDPDAITIANGEYVNYALRK